MGMVRINFDEMSIGREEVFEAYFPVLSKKLIDDPKYPGSIKGKATDPGDTNVCVVVGDAGVGTMAMDRTDVGGRGAFAVEWRAILEANPAPHPFCVHGSPRGAANLAVFSSFSHPLFLVQPFRARSQSASR